jgi:hypothetical protein
MDAVREEPTEPPLIGELPRRAREFTGHRRETARWRHALSHGERARQPGAPWRHHVFLLRTPCAAPAAPEMAVRENG